MSGVCGGDTSSTSSLPLGAECASTSQCSQSGGSVVCASNGIVSDGALNCCRNEGGPCVGLETSADCCGGLYCVEGICRQTTRDGGFALGAPCSSTEQCSQEGGAVACADNGIPSDGERNCCRYTGGACTGDVGCCAGLMCVNGVCGGTATASSGSLPPGATCSSREQCSQDGGATTCADNGNAADGELNCCRVEGGPCVDDAGCCFGLECVGGLCSSGSGGTTPAEGATGELPLGAACTSDEQCSQAGGEVACRDNGLPGDGERNCCRYQGGACNSDAGCCIGHMCVDGVCQG
ncbi:MAG: hypothetical protein IT337_03160 [Thermomicrobiales bacterium]|nr:hypothetical protein [Thermomicrobiales bacterium]